MKHMFGKRVFGFLLAPLCALAACVGEVDRPLPVESSIGIQEQSIMDDNLGNESIGDEMFNETPNVSACIAQCGDDDGCRHCCTCGGRPDCCF